MSEFKPITSADEMIALIREVGMIPFTRSHVPGWSIQEQTDRDFWFTTSDQLGPWDWKIEVLHSGIIYGKFISRCTCFATEEMYRHLMNWRRSLPRYQVAEGGSSKADTIDDRLYGYIAPILLSAIRANESYEQSELRHILEREVPMDLRKKVGGYVGRHLVPKVDRQAVDFLIGFLDMGTWTVVGDVTRVYRGPNREYKGWQRNTITTPDALLGAFAEPADNPFWAKFIEDDPPVRVDCSPEESRQFIIDRVMRHFPDAPAVLAKLIDG